MATSTDNTGVAFVLFLGLVTYWMSSGDTTTVRVSERQCTGGYGKDGSCIGEKVGASYKFILRPRRTPVPLFATIVVRKPLMFG